MILRIISYSSRHLAAFLFGFLSRIPQRSAHALTELRAPWRTPCLLRSSSPRWIVRMAWLIIFSRIPSFPRNDTRSPQFRVPPQGPIFSRKVIQPLLPLRLILEPVLPPFDCNITLAWGYRASWLFTSSLFVARQFGDQRSRGL